MDEQRTRLEREKLELKRLNPNRWDMWLYDDNLHYASVGVGLHKGFTLSSYLFALIMDDLTSRIQDDVPWCMLFIDDIVLISKTKQQLNIRLEYWRTFETNS